MLQEENEKQHINIFGNIQIKRKFLGLAAPFEVATSFKNNWLDGSHSTIPSPLSVPLVQ